MTKLDHKLGLYSHILPAVKLAIEREPPPIAPSKRLVTLENYSAFYGLMNSEEGVVFDCRELPGALVSDTGEAVIEDLKNTREATKLPFGSCYFEFEDESAVWATTVTESGPDGENEHDFLRFLYFAGWGAFEGAEDYSDFLLDDVFGEIRNGWILDEDGDERLADASEPYKPFERINGGDNPAADFGIDLGARDLFGVLSLMSEKLIAATIAPDPAPKLTRARAKRGLPRVSGERHVLRVNVPAIKRIARLTPVGSHESPCLHWRRGHNRVLHRGSEFESLTWVRKCLVGDPAKGFIRKSYRLTNDMPMMKPIPLDAPTMLGAE